MEEICDPLAKLFLELTVNFEELIQKMSDTSQYYPNIGALVQDESIRRSLFESSKAIVGSFKITSLETTEDLDHSYDSPAFCIVTGFQCNTDCPVAMETDGIAGTLALSKSLIGLSGMDVLILTDDRCCKILEQIVEDVFPTLRHKIYVIGFPPTISWTSSQDAKLKRILSCVKHIISIERPGQAKDGCYYTMNGKNISCCTANFDSLFLWAFDKSNIKTTAIGDRGNELGMGKLASRVGNAIPNGHTIGCVTKADFTIVAGISDWGAYALAASIIWYYFVIEKNSWFLAKDGFSNAYTTIKEEKDVAASLQKHGVCDAMSLEANQHVDGYPLAHNLWIHAEMRRLAEQMIKTIESIRAI
ncbi:hypothetical protein IE077_002741 [Cardiosporidium cionae]|uniref:D-glutamate cyclase-like C-terminal domain-containing protein n=1 Tax=Cardiosporidium cionae TaxID=476202 RepID=A0ABQ7JB25_9APIC|nr:hypothetical protein IE077_002741 [Cardiosporidium cionae]|eukprot:KAF8820855.1 hypothetical protein IE077_002741 [Cardiosporidium cionae]